MTRTISLLVLLVVWLGFALGPASACSCERPPADVRGIDSHKAWQFARAGEVVRGRVTSVRAGEDTVRNGRPVVLVTMKVNTVLKGSVESGEMTIVTIASGASCGMGGPLLGVVGADHDISLELFARPEFPNERFASLCGYYMLGPDPRAQKK